MDRDQLRAEVARVNWFHSIPLGSGVVTPGIDPSEERLTTMRIPTT